MRYSIDRPKTHYFFNNNITYRQSNLHDVKDTLANTFPSIEFVGIHYTLGLELVESDISETDFNLFWSSISEKAQKIYFNSHIRH